MCLDHSFLHTVFQKRANVGCGWSKTFHLLDEKDSLPKVSTGIEPFATKKNGLDGN